MFKDGKNDYVIDLESRESLLHVEVVLSRIREWRALASL
jgi:hypothetical protein